MNRRRFAAGPKRLLAILAVCLAPPAGAVDWSGASGVDTKWSTSGNWVGGVIPASANTTLVTFGEAPPVTNSLVDLPWTVNRLDFAGATPFGMLGAMLTFDGAAPQINAGPASHLIQNALVFQATVAIANDMDLLLPGGTSGPGGLAKSGPGLLSIVAPGFGAIHDGATTIAAGTVRVDAGNIAGPIVSDGIVELAPSGGGTVLAQAMSGTGALRVLSGSVTSGGPAFTHTGATENLSLLSGQFLGGGPLSNEGQVTTGDSVFGSISGTGTLITNGTAITVGGDGTDTTYTGPVTGVGGLTKVGAGRLTLANAGALYGGATTVGAGTLRIGNGVAAPAMMSGPIVNDAALELNTGMAPGTTMSQGTSGSGSLTILGGFVASGGPPLAHTGATTVLGGGVLGGLLPGGGPLAIAAGGQVDSASVVAASLSGAGVFNFGTLTVGSDNTSTAFTGPMTGTTLSKVGTGRLTLAGATVHGGQTDITAGTVRFGDGVTAPATIAGPIVVNGALEFQATTGTMLGGGVSGGGSLTVLGGSVASAGPPFMHSGPTTVNAGGILAGSFQGFGTLAIAAGGQVDAANSGFTTLSGAGLLNVSGVPGSHVGITNLSSTFGGSVGGPSTLSKLGTGTLTLSGSATNAGGVEVVLGTLFVTGTVAGPVTVFTGATLGGTGTIGGPVTINAGGTLAPGLSPGITNTGNLALGGVFLVEIEGPTLGVQYDNTNVTGTVTIAGGTLVLAGAYAPAVGESFTIITNDGADPVVGTFAGLPEGGTIGLNGSSLRITYVGGTGNDVVLTANAAAGAVSIPTLSPWGLAILSLLAGGAALAAGRRGPGRNSYSPGPDPVLYYRREKVQERGRKK